MVSLSGTGVIETEPVVKLPSWAGFDLHNFWMRADLRVRPEWRNGVCFGGGAPLNGACNSLNLSGSGTTANGGRGASDFYVQQWARLGLGYDPAPDINFYMELQDSATWGGNGNPTDGTPDGDALNHQDDILPAEFYAQASNAGEVADQGITRANTQPALS